jgi:hypothetical protein
MGIDFERECFFIAPIGEKGSATRKRSDGVRDFIVKEAAGALDLETRRADDVGEPGQITSQVIQHCLKAKVAVADLTDGNPNVYYELSVRHGAQLPVVLIAETGTLLPFDVGQSRVIFFEHSDLSAALKAREELRVQIVASLEGVPDNPIMTGTRLAKLQDGSGEEQMLGLVMERLERLGATTADIDERLRRSERRDALKRAVRSLDGTIGSGPSIRWPSASLSQPSVTEEDLKDAADAGLSPGAYADDEIIEEDEGS